MISGNKSKDPEEYWQHLRNKKELEELFSNFKNPEREPKMVIVVDMLLTGFDVPCLHTMYFDKPMKDHSLVQAIARVNRVFKDKPGGLIVDYIGIADNLRKSLSRYTIETIREVLTDINEVLSLIKEKYDIVSSFFNGLNYKEWRRLPPEKLSKLTAEAYNRIATEEKKKMFVKNFVALKKLYLLASPHPETYRLKDDIRFFEMIKKMIVKYSTTKVREISRDLEYEISQLISRSISAEEPIDIFNLLEKEKPEISILDESFLEQFRKMKYKNYAADLFSKIINDELRVRMRKNPFRYKSLYEMLKKLIEKYNVRLITTAEVIEELIEIAKEIKKKQEEGKNLKLSEEELAFYDLLSSKERVFENYEEIKSVAKAIVKELGYYIKVADWNRKDYLRAKIKMALKKALIKVIDARIDYKEIDKIASEILTHAEVLYA